MIRKLINFKDYQESRLRKLAYEDKNSFSEQVRRAVDIYLKVRNEHCGNNTEHRPENRGSGND